MKKTNKLWLTLLLAVLVASLLAAGLTVSAEETPAYAVGDHIQFGSYPQTRVEETDELSAAAQAATWKSYGYYTGTAAGVWGNDSFNGQMQPGDWMQFADFFCGGEKYRAVKFTQYRPRSTGVVSSAQNSVQDEHGYEPNTVYYFKYEPLTWRVLDPDAGFVFCEYIIDAQAFQNTVYCEQQSYALLRYFQSMGSTVLATDYAESSIRDWLNLDFYQTAFTPAQKARIQPTILDNSSASGYEEENSAPTNDKIFLLSSGDTLTTRYGFDSVPFESGDRAKMAQNTDYARCQGNGEREPYGPNDVGRATWDGALTGNWWVRTPFEGTMHTVYPTGEVNFGQSPNSVYGIRPACCLSTLGDDTTVADTLYSNVVDQGFCGGEDDGKNLVWTLDNAGTLTISGTGAMADYDSSSNKNPWSDYFKSLSMETVDVIVEEGVTSIGTFAFYDCMLIDQMTLPDSLTEITDNAFHMCGILHLNGKFPRSLKRIGNGAFKMSAFSIEGDLILPDGLEEIGSAAFWGSGSVLHGEVFIPDTVKKIGSGAFECVGMTTVRLPQDLGEIEPAVFHTCEGLQHIVIPSAVTTIGREAFCGCISMKTIVIPQGVTEIGATAFAGCTALCDVYYGGSEADWNAITIKEENERLLNANIHYNVVDWGYCEINSNGECFIFTIDKDGTLIIQDGVQCIGFEAFRGRGDLVSVVLPASITDIVDLAFYECGAIKDVFYAGDETQWNRITFWDLGIGDPPETGNDDLLNAHRHYNATWHTPGAAVIENEVASTCKTAGGYDEVVYCTQCPYEISRNHVTLALDPDNHEQVAYCEEVLPRPNHVEHGHEAGERCLACGEWLTGEEIHNTDGEWIPLAEATAEDLAGLVVREEDGDYIIICTKCGGRGLYKVENPPEDPTDPTQPTQPDQPDQPDQPGDNGGGENILTSITNGIRKAWNGFIEVFLRLIRWLGGGKK